MFTYKQKRERSSRLLGKSVIWEQEMSVFHNNIFIHKGEKTFISCTLTAETLKPEQKNLSKVKSSPLPTDFQSNGCRGGQPADSVFPAASCCTAEWLTAATKRQMADLLFCSMTYCFFIRYFCCILDFCFSQLCCPCSFLFDSMI